MRRLVFSMVLAALLLAVGPAPAQTLPDAVRFSIVVERGDLSLARVVGRLAQNAGRFLRSVEAHGVLRDREVLPDDVRLAVEDAQVEGEEDEDGKYKTLDLRERIGRAAYALREVATLGADTVYELGPARP